ncbi:MAG: DUF4214 domain-containing protein [Pseudomonadota bacterium]
MQHSQGQMPSMALVDLNDVTHTAVQSGVWSDASTWAGGRVPGDAARAYVPEGLTVTVDGEFSAELKTLRVDGVLDFATDVNTELWVDTLVTMPGSHLVIGTEAAPISADVTARIVFADDGVIDRTWDPSLISRGALMHGETTIYGAEKLAFTSLETPVSAGSTSITLSEDPTGWRVGDEITIAGTDAGNPLSDEVVTITQIEGRTITFDRALQNDHIPPRSDLDVHVANLTRNVEFASENSAAGHAGHVMFMHTNDADVRYFSMQGLGRTDKAHVLDDWQLVSPSEGSLGPELTEVMDLGGENVRGRYSLHFHRGGDEGEAALVQGAVVRDDPGWAYVNHSSNVDFIGNVSHNVVGAAYNTEAGDEVGSFVGNIAIRTVNPNGNPNPPDFEVNEDQSPDFRVLAQDFGWQGDGFWLHGPGVKVDNNVVAGASGHAFIYWPLGLVEEGLGEALAQVEIDGVSVDVRPKQIEVPSFDGNVAYGAPKALNIAYLHTDNRDDNDAHQEAEGLLTPVPQSYENQLQSTFSNFTAWNIELNAIAAPYSGRLTFENIDVLGTGEGTSIGIKLDQFANENDITVRNVTIDGFDIGIAAQRQGEGLIDGAQIAAGVSDIRVSMPDSAPRLLDMRNVEHLRESLIYSDLSGRVNISMEAAQDLGLSGGLFGDDDAGFFDEGSLFNVPPIFLPDRITYETSEGDVIGLYFDLQAPDFVPVVPGGELAGFVAQDIVGLTNSALYAQYGFAAGGGPAPEDTTSGFLVGGFSGAPAELSASFPPEPNPYWVDFLAEFGIEIPWQEAASASPDNSTGVMTYRKTDEHFTLELGETIRVIDRTGTEGDNALANVELLQFADAQFDLSRYDDAADLSAAQFSSFTEMYIAYFNRAPDAAGLMFWADAFATGTSLEEIAVLFAGSPEAQALYPSDVPADAFVEAIYLNVLGRSSDPAGAAFWSSVLEDGSVSRAEFVLQVLRGARAEAPRDATPEFMSQQQVDIAYLDAKIDVGIYFSAILGMSNVSNAGDVMMLYDGSLAGAQAAKTAADADFLAASASDGTGEFLIQLVGVVDDPFAAI